MASDCSWVPEFMVITGIPRSTAEVTGPLRTSKSAMVTMMPSGLEAAACWTIRAMSARSPVGGLR